MKSSDRPPGDEPDWHLLMEKLTDIEGRLAQMPEVPPSHGLSDKKLAVIATSIYRSRRRRLKYFEESLFCEPCWDMLLDLFTNRGLGRQVNVTSLCLAADVPMATGLRYIALLEEHGLLERTPSPLDRRVVYADLTAAGYRQMRHYLVDGIGNFDLPNPD